MLSFCVIGDPISHSKSPEIQGKLLKEAKIKATYEPLQVPKEALPFFMFAAKETYDGFNVTMPLKEDILQYVEEVDESVHGSCNLVTITRGRARAYNTDGQGFLDALGENVAGKNVVLLGYGGAGKELSYVLMEQGANLDVFIRDTKKREGSLDLKTLKDHVDHADLLINATPLGMMNYDNFDDFDFLSNMKKDATIADLVYRTDGDTKLIAKAKEMGFKTLDGATILQAISLRSFEILTGGAK